MTLQIERMSYGPDAIAHDPDGKTVFVSGGAVPGDVVEASLEEERPTFSRARLQRVAQPSDQRVDAPCPFVGLCGGCPWAHLSRQAQLDEKRDGVVGALTRIGHFDQDRAERLVAPAERPGNDWGYRNKIELGFSREGRRTVVGMHEDNGNGLVKVDACPLLDAQDKRLVKSLAGAMGYVSNAFDLSFERIGVRSSSRTRDVEVSLWTSPGGFPRGKVAKVLGDALRATSVVHVLSKGPSKARRVVGVERLSGKGYWTERVAGGRMALSAPSFFQVNTAGAERLVQLVMDALQPSEDDEAMDLYCGAGTFRRRGAGVSRHRRRRHRGRPSARRPCRGRGAAALRAAGPRNRLRELRPRHPRARPRALRGPGHLRAGARDAGGPFPTDLPRGDRHRAGAVTLGVPGMAHPSHTS